MEFCFRMKYLLLSLLPVFALMTACRQNADTSGEPAEPVFELLEKEQTGLDFQNLLEQSKEFNVFNYMYFFNGGGVAAADFNQDGLVDLYFTSNMGPNKLFLNEGNLKFRDVTEEAGVAGLDGWTSGASVADVNNDGLLDIYVGMVSDFEILKGQNQLFICTGIENGVPVFEDQAGFYGLDLVGFSTQAVFFDYDADGDLDMFQLNHSVHSNGTFGQKKSFENTFDARSGDKLMRNDGGKFKDVTPLSGIISTKIGYGLGVVAGDINMDGWPDLYVCNDFHEDDYLYINQQNGTFREVLNEQIMHTSRFSMGTDMADINNDGWSEVISLDMLPNDPYILKTSPVEDDYGVYKFKLSYGYNHQYTRNNLQLNNCDGTFSEIGIFSGIYATDWSWSPLFMDFENDGYKDLFISNGIPRRMNDIDYVNFRMADEDVKWKTGTNMLEDGDLGFIEKMPQIKIRNAFFANQKNLRFANVEPRVKNNHTSYSNGSVYADFDNDGDLDIVVNNIEDAPFFYKNLSREKAGKSSGDFLSFNLQGSEKNTFAVGARVLVFKKDGGKITAENFPVRGFQSSAQIPLHVGVGSASEVDSVLVVWPDRTYETLPNPVFNQVQKFEWKPNLPDFDFSKMKTKPAKFIDFQDITSQTGIDFSHKENDFVEFNRELLIPNMVSSEGPALAVGDVNGDGLDDVFFGSSKKKRSALYLQNAGGKFSLNTSAAIIRDSVFEDVDAVFADIDEDGDLDLAIAAGGNEFRGQDEAMRQRIYLNDGKGNFDEIIYFEGAFCTASCILPADFNGDGLVDFFIGSRAVPWKYGETPVSYLFENKGGGKFEEMTNRIAVGLSDVGLVKDGTWKDLDGDGDPDLLLAVEWQPFTIFYNEKGNFKKAALDERSGWWNFVSAEDLDGDGDLDILAGNMGENSKLKPAEKQPIRLYINDFDDNEQIDQILTYYVDDKEIPFANYRDLTKQLPGLKKDFLYAKDFARASLADLFGKEKMTSAKVLTATCLTSGWYEKTNTGYEFHALPARLQFSSMESALATDFDSDGQKEIFIGGNFYDSTIEMGRYDANFGNILSFEKDKTMRVAPLGNLLIKGQVRRSAIINIKGQSALILVRNNDAPLILRAVSK